MEFHYSYELYLPDFEDLLCANCLCLFIYVPWKISVHINSPVIGGSLSFYC